MNSDKLLEDLESLVMNASKMPFSNKKMVEEEEILQIIDDLKESMPAELEQAKKVLAEKDKIISDAQRRMPPYRCRSTNGSKAARSHRSMAFIRLRWSAITSARPPVVMVSSIRKRL